MRGKLLFQLLEQPLANDLHQFFLMPPETVISTSNLSDSYLAPSGGVFLELIGHLGVCKAIGKAVRYQNRPRSAGDICEGI